MKICKKFFNKEKLTNSEKNKFINSWELFIENFVEMMWNECSKCFDIKY